MSDGQTELPVSDPFYDKSDNFVPDRCKDFESTFLMPSFWDEVITMAGRVQSPTPFPTPTPGSGGGIEARHSCLYLARKRRLLSFECCHPPESSRPLLSSPREEVTVGGSGTNVRSPRAEGRPLQQPWSARHPDRCPWPRNLQRIGRSPSASAVGEMPAPGFRQKGREARCALTGRASMREDAGR